MTKLSLDQLRRDAKALRKTYPDDGALERVSAVLGHSPKSLTHSAALHVLACEAGFESWPKLKFDVETQSMNRAAKLEHLKMALFNGHGAQVERLLGDTPDLARDNLGIMCALYDVSRIAEELEARPDAIGAPILGPRIPILHLAFSRWWKHRGSEGDMLATAALLLERGADVNATYDQMPGMPLSALYGAIGHAQNLSLAEFLLDNGANPNDGESLYHGCDLGAPALQLLLQHGAGVRRTNALPRALDFNDLEMVEVLLEGGADPNEGVHWPEASGEAPFVIPALHQAARRLCSREIIERLLQAGGDPDAVEWGHTAYALARMFGNDAGAAVMAAHGCQTTLTREEAAIAAAVSGKPVRRIDPTRLPKETRDMIREQIHLPRALERTKALVAIGLDFDRPDPQGLTPVQIAGWEGLPDVMEYLLLLGPDLKHVNGYGGDLMSTILHGSENAHNGVTRDHIGCARLALEAGAKLRRSDILAAGDVELAEFLTEWSDANPERVVETKDG